MSRSIEEIARSAGEGDESYARDLKCRVFGMEEGALALSRFTDRFHDITLAMLVDKANFTILEVRAEMEKAPYDICKGALAGLGSLRGLSIYHRAVNREVRRRIPRRTGCTHLFELMEFTLASLFSGAPLAGLKGDLLPRPIEGLDPEEHRLRHLKNPWLQNTCCAFIVEKNGKENGNGNGSNEDY